MLKLRFDPSTAEEKNGSHSNDLSSASSSSSVSGSDSEIDNSAKKPVTKSPPVAPKADTENLPIYQDYMPDPSDNSSLLVDLEATIEKAIEKILASKSTPQKDETPKKRRPTKANRSKRARSESASSSSGASSANESTASGNSEEDGDDEEDTDLSMAKKGKKTSSATKKDKKGKQSKQKKTRCSSSSSKTLVQMSKSLAGLQKKVDKALEKRKKK
jgi:hypothetical protein